MIYNLFETRPKKGLNEKGNIKLIGLQITFCKESKIFISLFFLELKIAENAFDDLPHASFQDRLIFIFKNAYVCITFFNRQRRLNTRHVFLQLLI